MLDPSRDSERLTPAARRILAIVVAAVGVAQGFGRFTYPLLLPAIDRDLLHSYALAGWLGTANLAAYLVGTVLVSLAAMRLTSAALIQGGMVSATLGLALLISAPNAAVLLVGVIVTGVAGAFIWIPSPGLAGSFVSEHRRGLAIGLMASGIGIAVSFASALTRLVHERFDEAAWRPVWAVETVLAAAVTLLALVWLREPEDEDADPVDLDSVFRLVALRAVPGWIAITTAYAGYGLCYSIYASYLVAALVADAHFSSGHASNDFALVGGAIAVGGLLMGRLSDRFGRRTTLVGGFVLMTACPLLVLTGREPWIALSAASFGLCMSGLGSVIAAYVRDHTTERSFASAFAAVTLFFGVMQMIGPELGGALAEHGGTFHSAFWISALAAGVGVASSLALPRDGAVSPAA